MRIAGLAGKALPWTLMGIIVLIPILFVPNVADTTSLPKISLLFIGSAAALLLLFLSDQGRREVLGNIFRSKITLFVFALLLLVGASAFFAGESMEALLGSGTISVRTFIPLAALLLLFLISTQVTEALPRTLLVRALVFAPLLPVFLTAVGLFGILPEWLIERGTVAGPFPALLLLSAAGMLAALAASVEWDGFWRIAATIAALVHMVFGTMAYSGSTWIIVVFGGAFLLATLLKRDTAGAIAGPSIYLPAFILGFSVLFALGVTSPLRFTTPIVTSPTASSSVAVAKPALKEGLLLGYGPGQWEHAYAKYMPEGINETPFWAVRFISASSELTTTLTELGILGILGWLALMGALLWSIFGRAFRRSHPIADPGIFLPAAAFVVTLFVGYVTYFVSAASSAPLFWIAAGLLMTTNKSAGGDVKEGSSENAETGEAAVEAKDSSVTTRGTIVLTAFASILLLVALIFSGMRIAASAYAQIAARSFAQGEFEEAAAHFTRAISLDSSQVAYWQRLADASLSRLLAESDKPAGEADIELMRAFAQDAQGASLAAVQLRPQSASVWAQRARMHEEFQFFGIEAAADEAFGSWDRAVELDPMHPGYVTERGVLRLSLIADDVTGEDALAILEKARADFQQAIDLRPSFAPAHFQLALTASVVGNTEEAITAMENAVLADSENIEYGIQLGLLYMGGEREEEAARIFTQILAIESNFSNARYYLAILQARAGDATAALENIAVLIEGNSEETTLPQIRDNIQSGLDPLEGLTEEENAELENLSEAEGDSGDVPADTHELLIP